MTTLGDTVVELDIRAKLAQIDQLLAAASRKRQEVRLAPWQLLFGGMALGAGLLAASTGLLVAIMALMK
jgi:hypothetical protein